MADPVEDADLIAAELALGVLEGPERAAALARMLADPAFARAVDDWRERLAPLLDAVDEEAPPPALWPRIAAALGTGGEAGAEVTALRGSLARWRAAAASAAALAACALGWIAIDRGPAPPPVVIERRDGPAAPMMIAQLAPADAGPMAMAAVMPDGRLKIAPGAMAPKGMSAELWVVPEDGVPVSLGLVEPGRMNSLTIRAELRPMLNGDATLAISVEPAGGSPTGQPTGPVVASGRVTIL